MERHEHTHRHTGTKCTAYAACTHSLLTLFVVVVVVATEILGISAKEQGRNKAEAQDGVGADETHYCCLVVEWLLVGLF